MNIELGINVVFCGVAIVFLMLLILIGVMYIFGVFSKKGKAAKKEKVVKKPEPVKAAVTEAAVVSDGIDDEIVAVITAAVYSLYSGGEVVPKISFIKPASSRPVWAKAGIAQNTRAF